MLTYNPSLVNHKLSKAPGLTPLHAAAGTGDITIVRELLQNGASCHETDDNLEVPLHVACRQVCDSGGLAAWFCWWLRLVVALLTLRGWGVCAFCPDPFTVDFG